MSKITSYTFRDHMLKLGYPEELAKLEYKVTDNHFIINSWYRFSFENLFMLNFCVVNIILPVDKQSINILGHKN